MDIRGDGDVSWDDFSAVRGDSGPRDWMKLMFSNLLMPSAGIYCRTVQ